MHLMFTVKCFQGRNVDTQYACFIQPLHFSASSFCVSCLQCFGSSLKESACIPFAQMFCLWTGHSSCFFVIFISPWQQSNISNLPSFSWSFFHIFSFHSSFSYFFEAWVFSLRHEKSCIGLLHRNLIIRTCVERKLKFLCNSPIQFFCQFHFVSLFIIVFIYHRQQIFRLFSFTLL